MATLNIAGQKVSVGDGFMDLSPDQQNEMVGQIVGSVGQQVDIGKVLFGGGGQKEQPSVAADVAKQAGAGLVEGIEAIPAAAPSALGWVGRQVERVFPGDQGAIAEREKLKGMIDTQRNGGVTQYLPQAQTPEGKFARGTTAAIPGMVGATGGSLLRAAGVGAGVGAAGEAAGLATEGTAAEPYARIAAGLAAPVAMAGARRLVTPTNVGAGRQAMVDTLAQEGVTPTAGQRSGSKALQYIESTLGDYPLAGGQATAATNRSGEQFTRAALRRIGLEGNEITPAAVDRAVGNIQNEFQRLSSSTTMRLDRGLAQDIGRVLNRYDRKLPSQQREVINNIADDILAHGQTMPGDAYQVARSDLSRMAHAARNNDPTLSDALRGLREALDTAMRRSISPQDRAAWDQARRRWGNWRTIENAAKNTDEAGNVRITPQQLVQAASSRDRGGFARGLGDYNALARAGQAILRPMPQSGTTPRAIAAGAIPAMMAPAGILPALAGIAGPPLAGRLLMSGPFQRYLSNQAMGPAQTGRNIIGAAPGSLLQLQ